MKKTSKKLKEQGYLHYFDWEMYLIVCMSYIFGFGAGWIHGWFLPISLLFYAIPFYMKHKSIHK